MTQRTVIYLGEHNDTRKLGFGVIGDSGMEDEDPWTTSTQISFHVTNQYLERRVQQRTHVTACLGRHIFMCLRDEHCVFLVLFDLGVCLAVGEPTRLRK